MTIIYDNIKTQNARDIFSEICDYHMLKTIKHCWDLKKLKLNGEISYSWIVDSILS